MADFSEDTKADALARAGGQCECERTGHDNHLGRCTSRGPFQYHHRTAEASGGDNSLSNCEVLCERCHKQIPTP